MDQTVREMRKIALLLFTLFSLSFAQSQSVVDSVVYEGKEYYVYPFRKEIKIHDDYWKVIDDDAFFADYNNYFNHFNGDFLFSREKFQTAKTQKRKDELQEKLKKRWKNVLSGRKFGRAIKKAVRENPGELIEVSYDHDKDVLPPFGNIPDGEYVQLFEDVCIPDEDGRCQPGAYQVAGYFTIKNNAIDGEAIWLNFKGDTLKKGTFVNGLKEGEWQIKHPDELFFTIYGSNRRELRKYGSIETRFAVERASFKKGVNHGNYEYNGINNWQSVTGEFEVGIPSGEWKYSTNDRLTLRVQMASPDDSTLYFQPIIRGETIESPRSYYKTEDNKYESYDMSCREAPMPAFPNQFYKIQFGSEEELELDGENEKSFDLTDGREYDEFDQIESPFNGMRYSSSMEIDPVTGMGYPRWYVLDSLGARMKYEGVYEQYYMNGQLFFRYEFKNGQLLKEDTLFWDNGNPLDVIVFEADSNKYYRSLYARNGIRYDVMVYDSLGRFIEYQGDDLRDITEIELDGVQASVNKNYNLNFFQIEPVGFYYLESDTLQSDSLIEKLLLVRTWSMEDTTIQLNVEYDPQIRELVLQRYNTFGRVHSEEVTTFSEDFAGWTGTKSSNYGEFTVKGTRSGIRNDFWEGVDTLKHRSAFLADRIYDVSSDLSLFKNDELYTGSFKFKWRSGLFKLKSKSNKLVVRPSKEYSGYGSFYRAQKKKKRRHRFLMESITNDVSLRVANRQFQTEFLAYFEKLISDQNGYFDYYANNSYDGIKSIEGLFLDGKPHGVWSAYDRKGKVLSTLNFNKGEADGELKIYNYQRKEPKRWDYMNMNYLDADYDLDSFPKRKIRYLRHVVNYKNGQREGLSAEYDWLGRVKKSCVFKEDLMEGKMISVETSSYTEATFKNGYLDGYLRTFLTFPKRDSILLYDINLQNGNLNGESRSYHTNGRLAKRGFFLDGEPIEDYEAYDTLGFKFHYVKFEYGMPVEEKIWEENALSIRYLFDWKDSIQFYPEDITSTQSVEALLAREGYVNYSSSDRYYGRPALISKDGIECRMTKYYPNDTIARDGKLTNKQKTGHWKFYGYNGNFLYEANYFDSVIVINDSIKFKSKGILTDYDDEGNRLYSAYIIEKFEKYDCAHTDHYEIRQLITIDEENDSTNRMNGYVFNFYDNGTIQSEGTMKNGIPDGLWKFYDPFGKLNKMGNYKLGKRNGRWLEGDLAKKKYLGEICMNPNLPDLEKQQKYQENLLDITIINYMKGKLKSTQFYDVDMNRLMEIEESKQN